MANSSDIVAYTFAADIFCPACIIDQLPTSEGEAYDGWKLAAGITMPVEDNLNEIAFAFGIERDDESTFDSGAFPKVVTRAMLDPQAVNICGACFRDLSDD